MPADTILIITSEHSTPSQVMKNVPSIFKHKTIGTLPKDPPRARPGDKPLTKELGERMHALQWDLFDWCCAIVLESARLSTGPTVYALAQTFTLLRQPIIVIARPSADIGKAKGAAVTDSLHPDRLFREALNGRPRGKHFVPTAAEANAVLRAMISDGTIPHPT